MSLIICPECGKEFSDLAKACPNCGCPTELILQKKEQTEELQPAAEKTIITETAEEPVKTDEPAAEGPETAETKETEPQEASAEKPETAETKETVPAEGPETEAKN